MMAARGRPIGSVIRQNVVEILYYLGTAHGYQISKLYPRIFAAATRRVIYYHLKKGCDLGEFEVEKIEREQGDFSWGSVAEKTYYRLGKNARPRGLARVKETLELTTIK
ncbi:MAG TPA: hypothetical protein VJB66_02505 [Candidatus Nanoarchaeia archaeon]|nr:hypothetical protein [Candidatus Nanoarchaeia archaeon]